MMFEKLGSTKLHGKALMSALLVGFLSGCEISQCLELGALCELIDATGPPLEPIDSGRSTVFEDPGTLIAYHGFACAQSDSQGQEAVVNIELSIELPAYATDATVFLNGWRLEFLNGDHEVAGFGATITDIRTENQSLKWRASGVLSDQNFDDGYKFCHFFTAVAWNQTNLRLLVDHDDGSCTGTGDLEFNWFDAEHDKLQVEFLTRNIDGSRSSFASFLENPRLTSNRTVAVLPRGFAFRWRGCGDYDLHQTAYSLNPSAKFIEQGKRYRKGTEQIVADLPNGASQADYRFVTRDSDCILKSNTIRRRYFFGEIVSGLGGSKRPTNQAPADCEWRDAGDGSDAAGGSRGGFSRARRRVRGTDARPRGALPR